VVYTTPWSEGGGRMATLTSSPLAPMQQSLIRENWETLESLVFPRIA